MSQTCEDLKTQLVEMKGKGLSDKAKLVALLEACGMTDLGEMQDILECGASTLRTARAALKIERSKSSSARNQAPENERCARNQAEALEIKRQDSSAPSCAGANKESSSKINLTEEVKILPPNPHDDAEPVAEPAIAKPKATRTRGSRLDPTWRLPADWRMWARTIFPASTDEQVTSQADQFRDYWIAKPGAQACKLDWEATWRNWCRRGLSAAGTVRQPQHTGSFKQPVQGGVAAALAAKYATEASAS